MLNKLLELVYSLEGELDDAYNTVPEYNCNSEGKSYIDGARCTLYELKSQIEKMEKEVEEVARSIVEYANC
jgi:archaellum component FlaC